MIQDILETILSILNEDEDEYKQTISSYITTILNDESHIKDIEELSEIIHYINTKIKDDSIKYIQQKINDIYDIITYLKNNNIINKENIQLNLEKNNNQKQLVNYMLVDKKYKVYYNKEPKVIQWKEYIKEIDLRSYDCFLLNTYNNNNIFLCFNKKKVFYIYTVGLAYSKLFFENWIKIFLPKFLELFSDMNIVIYNYDKFMDEYYHYDVFKVEKIIEVLKNNNLKIYNFYYNEYLIKEYIDLIKDRKNYIILDFAHLFYYSFNKSIMGDYYGWNPPIEYDYINSIYFGFDNLGRLNKNSYLTDILEYKFFTKKEKKDIPYDITPIYYYISQNSFWNELELNMYPDQFEEKMYNYKNQGDSIRECYTNHGKDELLRIITNIMKNLEENIKTTESNQLRVLLEGNYIFGSYYIFKNIKILSLLYTKIKEWITKNTPFTIENIIIEYKEIINNGFIPYLRNEWDNIFKKEDIKEGEQYAIKQEKEDNNKFKEKWREHKNDIIEALFIEDYKICPN